jgi:xanthine dehydrogenase accessory factor
MNILQEAINLQQSDVAFALCTIVYSTGSVPRHVGSKMIYLEDGSLIGSVGGGETENRVIQEAKLSLSDGQPRKLVYHLVNPAEGDPGICGGTAEVFVEPYLPHPTVLVVGGGHVGKAVAHLAKWLGYKVVVSDDRPEFCTPEMNPDADEFVICPMAELPDHYRIHSQTYLVLTTRGVPVDTAGLPLLLETPAVYIGIIGSKRRWLTTRKNLASAGISEDKLNKVVSPIGVELKAETPEEIAVSIMAEIMMLRNNASGKRMTMQQSNG